VHPARLCVFVFSGVVTCATLWRPPLAQTTTRYLCRQKLKR